MTDALPSMMRAVLCAVFFAVSLPACASGEDDQFDVLVFASEGPVLLRVTFTSSQVGIATVRERFVKEILKAFDADKDGRLSADEAIKLPWADLAVNGADAADGGLTREELSAHVESTFGPRFVSRRKPPLLVQSVQLHERLDRDGDGHISRDEIEQGVDTLRPFDFDDDGTFSPAELQPFPLSILDAARNEQTPGDRRDFVVLHEGEPLDALAERMIATYAESHTDGLSASQLAISALAFAAFDQTKDGLLNADELGALLQRPRPAAEIRVDFRRHRVTLKTLPAGEASIRVQESESSRRLAARIGGEMVEFSAVDNRYQAADQIKFLRIDFRRKDQDKNGYLSPEEFAALGITGASFEEIDLDDDGQMFLSELDRFIGLDAYRAQSFAEMTIDAIDKPLFQILDENLDRRLTQREFQAGVERMQPYDRDEDGRLEADELLALRRYRVTFSFGVPPAVRIERQNQMDSSRRLPVVLQMTSGPEWFRKMDRNQDGDVTWREFLGPRDAFDRLDRDGSGWIDADEADGP